jgi:hypothetical protein
VLFGHAAFAPFRIRANTEQQLARALVKINLLDAFRYQAVACGRRFSFDAASRHRGAPRCARCIAPRIEYTTADSR